MNDGGRRQNDPGDGRTGKQGGAVARELLDRGHHVRAMTRKPDSEPARALRERHATVVQGDLNDPASLERALDGAWGMLAVQSRGRPGSKARRNRESGSRSSPAAHS
ncbi:MAG: NmrA family NAD(P)-binding protein [Planctomycetaceae bacterium]